MQRSEYWQHPVGVTYPGRRVLLQVEMASHQDDYTQEARVGWRAEELTGISE